MLDHTPKAYGYSVPKVKGTMLQLLVAFCVLHGVSATAVTPAASGLSSPSPTCGCSEEIAALQEEIGAMKVFMGMMPPSTPPSPPPSTPPSPPPPSPSPPPPSPSPPPPSLSPPPPTAPVCRVLISRQTVVAGDSWLRADAEWSINPLDPSAAQFSILDQLEGMGRNPDGDNKILFELYWPELEGTLKGPRQLWKQSSNPVIGVPGAAVEGYEAVDAPYTGYYWGGLQRSGSSTLLDGSTNGYWFYAVGSRHVYGGGIPGPGPEKATVSQTELYVHTPCASLSPPPPSSPPPTPPPPTPPPPTPPPPTPPPPSPSPPFQQCIGLTQCPPATPYRYPDNYYGANNRCFERKWGGAACNVDPQNDPYPHQRNDVQCNCYTPPLTILNPPENSRLYSSVYANSARGTGFAQSMINSPEAWSAGTPYPTPQSYAGKEWMYINAGAEHVIHGVVTQGRHNGQLVTSYKVHVYRNGWVPVLNEAGSSTFTGNTDKHTQVWQRFRNPETARYVKFTPLSWIAHISMRAGLLI